MSTTMSVPRSLLVLVSLFHLSAALKLRADVPKEFTVEAGADVSQLHMVLHNLPPVPSGFGVTVDAVDAGFWADKAGIKKGFEIVTINGKVAKDLQMQEFIRYMKARPIKLMVRESGPWGAPTTVAPPAGPWGAPTTVPPPVAAAPAAAAATTVAPPAAPQANVAVTTAPPAAAAQPAATTQAPANAGAVPAATTAAPKPAARARAKQAAATTAAPKLPSLPEGASETAKAAYAAAVAAGRAAGAAAGSMTAKKLVAELRKVLGLHKPGGPAAAPAAAAVVAAAPAGPGQWVTGTAAVVPPTAPAPAPALPPVFKAVDANERKSNEGPPEPVPPSPLDALRAAMAIRAGMNASENPILSPDVIEKVANYAKGKLGAFVPPGALAPAAAQAPCRIASPAPAPIPMGAIVEKVEISMTVKNMSFTALSASPSMLAEFEQSVKQSMAESAGPGVKAMDVEVTLHAGSVIVDSKITPPPGVTAADMDNNMASGNASLGTRLIARVAALPGIDSIALGTISATGIVVKVVQEVVPTTPTTTTTPPSRHLPKPPKCAAAPPQMSKGEVAMALAPFKPPGARGKAVKTKDGGSAWPLTDGGWAFQYPDMALRMQEDGSTRIVWSKPAYSVEYDESGISYHVGQNVVHRDTNGDLTYQQPTGTMHQEGDTLVYHWCNPNVIVYQTPAGFVYYDDMGMTYRSFGKDVTHYTWSGEVLYQGAGGVTSQGTDGTVTHWTDAGAVYRHKDGSVTYTPVGESTSSALSVSDLGPDPFPGAELTAAQVMEISVPAGAAPVLDPAWKKIDPR